ncbi:c-type cytochrome domain-containing protein, partial [Singulisphaera rosea]
MTRRTWAGGLLALFSVMTMAAAEEPPTYERELKPFFAKRCTACHNAKKVGNVDVSGGLALDTYEAVTGVANNHKVVVPGKASESELFRRLVEGDEDKRMPMSEKPLAPAQQDLVRRWIEAGVPRGEPVAELPKASTRPARRFVRSLDVRLPTEAKVPADLEKLGVKGAIELS